MTHPADPPIPGGWTPAPAGAATTTGPTGDRALADGTLAPLGPDARFRAALAAALAPALEVDRELEGGGMARVFVAREVALGRRVVVKVLPPDLAAGVNRERFRREIQLAAALQHPHIVPLLAAGEVSTAAEELAAAAGSLYYTMPFIEGESLRAEAAARGAQGLAFAPREVLRILRDVVGALGYAHARGVVHRDVKPGNVLLQHGHALVTDFGVAKALAAALPVPAYTVTTFGMAVGTPAYMAPEQLAADPAADHRVDLYAAGLVAYELLSGASPFAAASPQATLAAQLTRVPEPLTALRPDVPPALAAVVMQCLAKDPAARPASATELLAALDAADGDAPAVAFGAARTTSPVRAAPATLAPPTAPTQAMTTTAIQPIGLLGRRRRALVAAGACAALGVGVWVALGGSRPVGAGAGAAARAPRVAPAAEGVPAATASSAVAPVLSRADSIAIARAVAREFERATAEATARTPDAARAAAVAGASATEASATRASATGASATAATPPTATPPTGAADSARLRRVARNAVADSLARGAKWGHVSRDVVRAVVGGLAVELPSGVSPEDRLAVLEALRRAKQELHSAGVMPDGEMPPVALPPPPPPPAGMTAKKFTPWPGFAAVTAGMSAPAPGVRRAVLVATRDDTGRPEFAPLAAMVDAALRKRLQAAGPFEVTNPAVAVTARRERVPDAAIVRATGADAVLRAVLRAEGDAVHATLVVRGSHGGRPAVIEARVPNANAASIVALRDSLAAPLARAAVSALGGGRGHEDP